MDTPNNQGSSPNPVREKVTSHKIKLINGEVVESIKRSRTFQDAVGNFVTIEETEEQQLGCGCVLRDGGGVQLCADCKRKVCDEKTLPQQKKNPTDRCSYECPYCRRTICKFCIKKAKYQTTIFYCCEACADDFTPISWKIRRFFGKLFEL